MTIQTDNNGQPLVAALQFPVYRLSEFDWKNWTPASRFYYTQFIGIDDTATPVVYSLRYCVPGVAGGVGQVSSNTLEDFQAEIADVLTRQDKIDLDVADLLAQVNSLLTTAQDVAAQAQSSVTSSAQSAASASDSATTSQTWAEGEDAAVSAIGGAHSSKGWAGEAESHATAAHNDYISMTTDANVVAVGSNIDNVNSVAQSISNVNTVAGDISAVNNVVSNINDINTVAGISGDVSTVAGNTANINTVVTNIADVNTTATNIAAIQDAPNQAAQASQSATSAAQSAQIAEDKADEASESARVAVAALSLQVGDVMFAPLGIDESLNLRRYLNGQVLIQSQFVSFTNKVKSAIALYPNLATTEENWQAEKTNSKLGQCGKFVVDDTAGTIRLPAVVNAQGLVDLSLIGGIKSESLPNHYHVQGASASADAGVTARYGKTDTGISTSHFDSGGNSATTLGYNTSGAYGSSTYQDNAPVQQEAVQYPYCIVVNTGVEEAERPINNYQVNNVYSYGMSQYYKGTMNNNSWLKSAGQWNDGNVYTGMYNWLLEQMNAGVSGFVASTAAYTDYDFVINTADQTFRLPLLDGSEDLPSDRYVEIEDKTDGSTHTAPANGFFYCRAVVNQAGGYAYVIKSGTDLSYTTQSSTSNTTQAGFIPVSKDDVVTLAVGAATVNYFRFIYAKGNGNLYYYIGDTLQHADLINVARIEEKLTDVNAASRGYVVESYRNGTEWYRIYSDGWIEQGGMVTSNSGTITYNFITPFKDTNYGLLCNQNSGGLGDQSNGMVIKKVSNSQFSVLFTATSTGITYTWYACGY